MAVKFGISMAFRCHFNGHGSGISMAITMAIAIIFGFIMTVSLTKVHLVHRNASRRAVPFFRHKQTGYHDGAKPRFDQLGSNDPQTRYLGYAIRLSV
jgi:hypothetical protein